MRFSHITGQSQNILGTRKDVTISQIVSGLVETTCPKLLHAAEYQTAAKRILVVRDFSFASQRNRVRENVNSSCLQGPTQGYKTWAWPQGEWQGCRLRFSHRPKAENTAQSKSTIDPQTSLPTKLCARRGVCTYSCQLHPHVLWPSAVFKRCLPRSCTWCNRLKTIKSDASVATDSFNQ